MISILSGGVFHTDHQPAECIEADQCHWDHLFRGYDGDHHSGDRPFFRCHCRHCLCCGSHFFTIPYPPQTVVFKGGQPWPVLPVLLIGLLIGAFGGFINGGLIAKFKIPPFVATLGMMTFARGWAFIYSEGRPRGSLIPQFEIIGQGSLLGIPNPAWILLICVLITHVILKHTLWGRYTYALGSNIQAAIVSGINTNRYILLVYTYAGFLSAVASIVLTARIGSGQPGLGMSYELDAIAASVIGGTSLSGGIGSAGGALIGALIIGVMKNGLDILNVSADFQQVMRAIIIVVAVIIDVRKNIKKS